MDITIKIGGEAGQGLQFIGSVLARYLSRNGLHVFTHQDYMSRIRGGHNFYQIRVAERPVHVSTYKVDILLAMDEETILEHREELSPDGIVIYDSTIIGREYDEPAFLDIQFREMTEQAGVAELMANTAAIGAILGGLNLDLEGFQETIRDFLPGKGEGVIEGNFEVAKLGWEFVRDHNWPDSLRFTTNDRQGLMLINGNQAVGFGALISGCRFLSAYPMTPSTGIMIYLAAKAKEHNIVVEQAEDEISAINMALGASFGGVRSMTTTSGGGFALMTEGLSLAGMVELPLVIAEVQRPGPATGLPTRTEQGDLLFVLYAGHGEFPRIVFTPGTPEQALRLTNKAFELAEKYQIQAIVQSDQYLADAEWTCKEIDVSSLFYMDHRDRTETGQSDDYRRFAVTESGVSPLVVPGFSKRLVVVDSDEHDEEGHIIEDGESRNKMVDKRLLRKMLQLQNDIAPPDYYGHEKPVILLVGYGSTYGVMREAVDAMNAETSIALLHFSEVWPFPTGDIFDFIGTISQAKLAICVENNATGQFARLIRSETGFNFQASIRKYDGRPFLLEPFLGEVHEYLGQV